MQAVALAVPVGLVALAAVGHRDDPVYAEFLRVFAPRLGGTPLFLALLAAAGFYLYAWARRVPFAVDGLTAAVAALAVVGPDSLTVRDLGGPLPFPVYAAGVLQLAVGMRRWDALRCLAGGLGVAACGGRGGAGRSGPSARRSGSTWGWWSCWGSGPRSTELSAAACRTLGGVLVLAACLGAV